MHAAQICIAIRMAAGARKRLGLSSSRENLQSLCFHARPDAKSLSTLVGIALALAVTLAAGTCKAQAVHLLTEDYPPYAFMKGSRLVGSSVDQVRRIMEEAYPDYTLDMVPWARAFATAETEPATCVFTTTVLPERVDRFKWVQPLSRDVTMLVRRAGEPFRPTTIEEAKRFSIAVHRGDSAEIFAKKQGFPRLDSAPSMELSLKKLLGGRVDLMLMTRKTFESLREQGQPVEAVLDVNETRAGIACNKGVADETIAAMQTVLDRLIASGAQAEIERAYDAPEK